MDNQIVCNLKLFVLFSNMCEQYSWRSLGVIIVFWPEFLRGIPMGSGVRVDPPSAVVAVSGSCAVHHLAFRTYGHVILINTSQKVPKPKKSGILYKLMMGNTVCASNL